MALAAIATIGLASCNKCDSPVDSNSTVNDEISSLVASTMPPFDQYAAVTSFDGVTYTTDDATPAAIGDRRPPGGPQDKKNLSAILRCLELSAEQRTQIEGFMKAARECMQAAEAPYRDAVKALREEHHAKVKALREAVKAGTMTKEEARTELREAEKAYRTALEELRASMMRNAKECEVTLFRKIHSVLDEAQQAKWVEWVKTGKVPCNPTDGGRVGG